MFLSLLMLQMIVMAQDLSEMVGKSYDGKDADFKMSFENDKDFTGENLFTGDVNFALPIASIGGLDLALSYNSNVHPIITTPNWKSQSGWVGVGWTLEIGSITADINKTIDPSDDKYYYQGSEVSSELLLMQDSTNSFELKDFRFWKITRITETIENITTVVGWEIVREDGRIYRYGNYDVSSENYVLDYEPTKATRFMLAFGNYVGNGTPSAFGDARLAPYQWDLSLVQDIHGNQTKLDYAQVKDSLAVDYPTTNGTTTIPYTRESYLNEIMDRAGSSIQFVLGNTTSDEYQSLYAKNMQQQYGTKFLDKIKMLGLNGQLANEIVFGYDTAGVYDNSIRKRYLTSISKFDTSGNSLPSRKFEYYGVAGLADGANHGALKKVILPTGGEVEYEYTAEQLANAKLDSLDTFTDGVLGKFYVRESNALGVSGSDFYAVRKRISGENYIDVYRWGAKGWYLDISFPWRNQVIDKAWVRNDYIVVRQLSTDDRYDTFSVCKRERNEWREFSHELGNCVEFSGVCATGFDERRNRVIGMGNDFFVVAGATNLANEDSVHVFRWAENDWKVDFLGTLTYAKTFPGYDPSKWGDPEAPILASCGNRFFVLAHSSGGSNKVWNWNGQQWQTFSISYTTGEVYMPFAGDDYFLLHTQELNKYAIAYAWNGTGWSQPYIASTPAGEILSNLSRVTVSGNYFVIRRDPYIRLFIRNVKTNSSDPDWLNTGSVSLSLWDGYYNFYNCSSNMINRPDMSVFGFVADPNYDGHGLIGVKRLAPLNSQTQWESEDETVIAKTGYAVLGYDPSQVLPLTNGQSLIGGFKKTMSSDNGIRLYAYQKKNDQWIEYEMIDESMPALNSVYGIQPGGNFVTTFLNPNTSNEYEIDWYRFQRGFGTDFSEVFKGYAYDFPVTKKTVRNGHQDSSVTTFMYENGSYDENVISARYNKATTVLPGNNGKIERYFYNGLELTDLEDWLYNDYDEQLDKTGIGLEYRRKYIDQAENVIKEIETTWNTFWRYSKARDIRKMLIAENEEGVRTWSGYNYNWDTWTDNGLPQLEFIFNPQVSSPQQKHFIREFDYAYEEYPSMANAHIFNQVYEERILSGEVDYGGQLEGWSGDTVSAIRTTFQNNLPWKYQRWLGGGQWQTVSTIDQYDIYGNPTEISDANGTLTSYKWGYNSSVPTATIANSRYWESSATSFEHVQPADFVSYTHPEEDDRWWRYVNGSGNSIIEITDEDSYTGKQSLKIIPSTNTTSSSGIVLSSEHYENEFIQNKTYIISAWVKSNTNAHVDISYKDDQGQEHYGAARDYHSGSGEWEYLETKFTVPEFIWVKFHLQTSGQQPSTDKYAYFDEVRIYPADALVTSQTIDPAHLKTNSQTDESGITLRYEVDDFGALSKVVNSNNEPLNSYGYSYSRSRNGDTYDPDDPNYVFSITSQDGGYFEDFNETALQDWLIAIPHSNITWSIEDGRLRSTESQSAGYSYICYPDLDVADQDLVIEYDTYFSGNATWGGIWYRGEYCDVNPNRYGWRDASESFITPGFTRNEWHRVKMIIKHATPFNLSTLYIDGKEVFANEPIQIPIGSYPRTDVGFVSNYYYDYVEYDNASYTLNPVITVQYFDGLSRQIQSNSRANNQDIIIATEYDALDRIEKEFKPFYKANNLLRFVPDYLTEAKAYYDGSPGPNAGNYPFITYEYYNDPLNRLKTLKPQGTVFQNDHYISYTYDVNIAEDQVPSLGGGGNYAASTLFKNITTDENENDVEIFTDILGNTVLQRQYLDANRVDTKFQYDIQGNLLQSVDPDGKPTKYLYNTLNQLVAKTMPDLDGDNDGDPMDEDINHANPPASDPDMQYKYDINGNIRFIQDPDLKAANRVYFYTYDPLNRIAAEGNGVPPVSWSQLDPDYASYTFDDNPDISYHYDLVSAAHPEARNLRGKLAWVEYNYDLAQTGYTYYSYNNLGLAEWIIYEYDDLAEKKVEYIYNTAGQVSQLCFRDLVLAEEFYLWYEYNELGQIKSVYHNIVDSKPSLETAFYDYWPTGQPKTLKLGEISSNNFAQVIDYEYTPRDWLNKINQGALSGNDKFALELQYNSYYNGNIDYLKAVYADDIQSVTDIPVTFGYDGINRLTSASGLFGASYQYSDNGNILSKTIQGTPYTYSYGNSNRLLSFGSTQYQYDYNGNLKRETLGGNYKDFSFNYRNQLQSIVPNAISASYFFGYSEQGSRIYSKITDGIESVDGYYYFYDAQNRLIAVYNLDDEPVYFNIWGPDLIGKATYNY